MVSFIIPSYNRSSYLIQLLGSILSQDYAEIEIIVVDDNSIDNTETIMEAYVKKYPFVKYYKNERNMGCGYSRGFGFNKSKGKFIVFADDDDYYTNNSFLSKSIKFHQQYPDLAFVSGRVCIKEENNNKIGEGNMNIKGYINRKEYLKYFHYKYSKPQSTFSTVFKQSVLEQSNVSNMKMVNDASIYMRSLLYGDAYIMEDIIGTYRIHDTNITKSLTPNFIIENLDEKRYIYEESVRLKLLNRDSIWLEKQIKLTISYYFSSSKVDVLDFFKILKWGVKNVPNKIMFILLSIVLYIKSFI